MALGRLTAIEEGDYRRIDTVYQIEDGRLPRWLDAKWPVRKDVLARKLIPLSNWLTGHGSSIPFPVTKGAAAVPGPFAGKQWCNNLSNR